MHDFLDTLQTGAPTASYSTFYFDQSHHLKPIVKPIGETRVVWEVKISTSMSQTLSNSSLKCNFTSPKEFLHVANNQSAIITQVINDCPHVCNVFYGTGNPDIIGVGISRPLP